MSVTTSVCATAEAVLHDNGEIERDRHEVASFRYRRSAAKEVSGQSRVPVLADSANGIQGMPESDEIVAYLERKYG